MSKETFFLLNQLNLIKGYNMAVVRRTEREDSVVECLIDSTNIIMSEYDESKSKLTLTFKAGTKYLYHDILKRDYLRFEVSESQGEVFNKTLRKYKYDKLDSVDVAPIKELISEAKGIN
jgi:hypothetical protein